MLIASDDSAIAWAKRKDEFGVRGYQAEKSEACRGLVECLVGTLPRYVTTDSGEGT